MSLILMTSLVDYNYSLIPQQKTWLYSLLRREHSTPSPPGSLNCAIKTTTKIFISNSLLKKEGVRFRQ